MEHLPELLLLSTSAMSIKGDSATAGINCKTSELFPRRYSSVTIFGHQLTRLQSIFKEDCSIQSMRMFHHVLLL
jgi:hypothetical protein